MTRCRDASGERIRACEIGIPSAKPYPRLSVPYTTRIFWAVSTRTYSPVSARMGTFRMRRAPASHTRQDILAAEHQLFLERGYTGTTLAGIAQGACVVVGTIDRAFREQGGTVQGLGRRPSRAAPLARRSRRAAASHPGRQRRDRSSPPTAALCRNPARHPRGLGPLFRILTEAAATDPELAEVWIQLEDQRLAGLRRFAQLLAERGASHRACRSMRPATCSGPLTPMPSTTCSSSSRLDTRTLRDWLAATLTHALPTDTGEPVKGDGL
jgi:AcrR family transcriptional regulator